MKKLNFLILTGAALLMSSCSNDDQPILGGIDGDEVIINYSISLPSSLATRAYGENTGDVFGEANEVKTLHYAVYATGSTTPLFENVCYGVFGSGNLTHQLPLSLVTGKTYDLVFWADAATESDAGMYAFKADGQTIEVNYPTSMANFTETADGFFGQVVGMKVTGAMSRDVELRRPFAQLNIGTDDVTLTSPAVKAVSVTVPVYSKFNMLTGEVIGTATDVTFGPTDFTTYVAQFPVAHAEAASGKKYQYLAMDYLLVNQRELVTVTMQTDDATAEPRVYNNVPVQRNYRTNIYGSLLTSSVNFTVKIEKDFEQPDNNMSTGELVPNAEGVYEISSITQMLQLPELIAEKAHGEGSKLKLALVNDINMAGFSWTPLNLWWVTFDGRGHTISNLNCGMSAVGKSGFAAYMGGGEIKNLTLKNVTVTGAQAGIISGQTEGATVDNVTITGVNTVNYAPNTGTYQETWCGVGALYGMCNTKVSGSGVTIAEDAVVNVYINGMDTEAPAHDNYTYYTSSDTASNNPVTVENKGTVNIHQ